jgi:hypothetical protein
MAHRCQHCGSVLADSASNEPELPYALAVVLRAVRDAGDLWTHDVASVCGVDVATARERLEVLRDGLGLIGHDPAGDLWLAEPQRPPTPEELAREWRARGLVAVQPCPAHPRPDTLLAAALPRVSRTLLGQLRRRGAAVSSDLEAQASREGVRRSLQRLQHDGWIVADTGIRHRGAPLQLWRVYDVAPVDLVGTAEPRRRLALL